MCLRQPLMKIKRLIPDSVASRTLLVLIIGLTVSHVLSIAFYFSDRTSELLFYGGEHVGERIATIDRLIENSARTERQRLVELADNGKLHVIWSEESAVEPGSDQKWETKILRDALIAHLGERAKRALKVQYTDHVESPVWMKHAEQAHAGTRLGETFLASLQLSDGSWLNFAAPKESPQPFWTVRFVLSLLVMLLAVVVLSALIVRHLTRPLAVFSQAAHRLGLDVNAPPLHEDGPSEVRQATRAFNQMQHRLRRFVEDRTQMVAAIAHDLGTPITRLRLRAEFIEDEQEKQRVLADLEDMERMVFATLSFARDDASSEPRAVVDLNSLIQRVHDSSIDMGQSVTVTLGTNPVPFNCQPVAFRRALTNLIDNAVKYGQSAQVQLNEAGQRIQIRIDDNGPGIPDNRRADVFKPFYRIEESRSRDTGGTGLGLTVARTIIHAHGGDIVLRNRPEGGLRVEITLPRQGAKDK